MQLDGKVALVTGGTKGIGAAAAVALARGGADVAINGRHDDPSARETLGRIESLGRRGILVVADVGRPDEATRCVRETAERLGPVDVLVHSAGGSILGGLLDVSPEAWHEAFDVHVHAVYYLARAAVPAMKTRREGAIILVSSVAGLRGLPSLLAYQTVKGAIPQLARGLARELADDNIRVNAVAPGVIATRFHAGLSPERRQYNVDHRIPLHREGTADEVASLIVELATNDYITGETLVIDGGLTMRIA
ncbi:MAG: SDR family oxidoreductase [Pirellulales bacterium]|nr:SDR family oxidoreductase [Pirellulales bacterium]